MKDHFGEYYRPSEHEFRDLWENCVFAIDASVLLNVYAYSETTREQLLGLLERLSDRIRMPHQFALEYQRNRVHAIDEQVRNYAKVEEILDDLFKQHFRPITKHPFLSRQTLKLFDKIRHELSEGRKKHDALFRHDDYFDRLTALIKVVSPQPNETQLQELHANAKKRYALRIPPGYSDLKEKGEPGAYGDYIGWTQLVAMAKKDQKPLILLNDDGKEDWWQIQGHRTIGPRPELIAEFHGECGAKFYMYSSNQFMRFAGKYLKESVEEAAIEEIAARLSELRGAGRAKSTPKATTETPSLEKTFVPSEPIERHEPKSVEPPPPIEMDQPKSSGDES
jgi:PIN like domain